MSKESMQLPGLMAAAFLRSSIAILFLTGMAKVWSALAGLKVLAVADPLTGLSFKHLLLAAGITELVVAVLCILIKSAQPRLFIVAWMATNLVVYRIGLWAIGWQKPCSCMGNLTDALHIPPQTADTAMKIILAYLLIGSYASLFWLWRQNKKAVPGAVGAASV